MIGVKRRGAGRVLSAVYADHQRIKYHRKSRSSQHIKQTFEKVPRTLFVSLSSYLKKIHEKFIAHIRPSSNTLGARHASYAYTPRTFFFVPVVYNPYRIVCCQVIAPTLSLLSHLCSPVFCGSPSVSYMRISR